MTDKYARRIARAIRRLVYWNRTDRPTEAQDVARIMALVDPEAAWDMAVRAAMERWDLP